METPPKGYDEEWRKASVTTFADFKGLLGFRQFRLTTNNFAHFGPYPRPRIQHFTDDFTLASVFNTYTWRPRRNIASCSMHSDEHAAPKFNCTCGFYASYSSTIVYHSDKLLDRHFCFGAVRLWGDDLPLAQNGLRAAGANVDGLLLRPDSKGIDTFDKFLKRLKKEDIFYTFSAREFIRRFPDQSYSDLLKFDPIQRLANLSIPNPIDMKTAEYKFCRPLRDEMLMHHPITKHLSIRPEYRPGGRLWKHPLLEVWAN